jgi:hypothetical protein
LVAARKNHGLTKIGHKGARAAVESALYDATRRYCAAWSIAGPCLPGLWRVHDFLHVAANSANVAAVCLAEGKAVAAPHRRSHRAAPQRPNQVLERQAGEPVRAHCHESRKKFVENRGFDKTIGADCRPIDLRHPVYRYP